MNFRVFLAAACAAASAAFATPFSYGDILVSSSTAIYRYNQSGTLLQTFGTGGFGMAFDSSGNLYVANGSLYPSTTVPEIHSALSFPESRPVRTISTSMSS